MSPNLVLNVGNPLLMWHCSVESHELIDDVTFHQLLERLTQEERQRIAKFIFPVDQKRAFLSLLLQHAMAMQEFQFPSKSNYRLIRTKEVRHYLQ